MKTNLNKIERRLRVSAVFLFIGLTVQLVTLRINHPLAFLVFILAGSPIVLAGAVFYLWSLVSDNGSNQKGGIS